MFGFEVFKTFTCPKEAHPLVFAQICTLYHQGKAQTQSVSSTSNSIQSNSTSGSTIPITTSAINLEINREDHSPGSETVLGQVWVGSLYKAICILANSVKVVKGKTSKIARQLSCMINARSQNNLPMGVMLNWTTVTPTNSKTVPVTLLNTKSYNVWICQSLLAVNIVEVEHCPWDFHSAMSCDGDQVQVSFCPVPIPEVQAEVLSFGVSDAELSTNTGVTDMTKREEQGERPNFGPRPKFDSMDFDFNKELE